MCFCFVFVLIIIVGSCHLNFNNFHRNDDIR